MIRAGDLDKRITVQAKTVTYNGYNEPVESWAELATVWAEAITKDSKGREFTAAQKLFAETTVVFRVRYRAEFTPLHRVAYNSRVFEILGVVDVDFDHEELRLACKEVV
jgi:SPP1 family predicted phage head-tail adaptor